MGWLSERLGERTGAGPASAPVTGPQFSPIPSLPDKFMPEGAQQPLYHQAPDAQASDYIYDTQGNKVPNIYKPWQGNAKDGWAGDPQTRTSHCPQCGGTNFFSRKSTMGAEMGLSGTTTIMTKGGERVGPAPHCWDCGYTGGSVNLLPFGGVTTGQGG